MRTHYLCFLISSSLMITPAFAGGISRNWNVKTSFGPTCIGLDGVPIAEGTSLYGTCCDSHVLKPNAPVECKGFAQEEDKAGGNATGAYQVAQRTLGVSRGMNGNSTDYGDEEKKDDKTKKQGSTERSAVTAGGYDGFGSGRDPLGATGIPGGSDLSGNGYGGAFNPNSGSGSGFGSGIKPDKIAKKDNSDGRSGSSGDYNAFGYVGGEGQEDAPTGPVVAAVSRDGSLESQKFDGEEEYADSGYGEGYGEDTEAALSSVGVSQDPADYFSRIDQSANIFKIVSARYLKKKRLFKINVE